MHLPMFAHAISLHLPVIIGQAAAAAPEVDASWDLGHMWGTMGWVARGVFLTLGIMPPISRGRFIQPRYPPPTPPRQPTRFPSLAPFRSSYAFAQGAVGICQLIEHGPKVVIGRYLWQESLRAPRVA